MLNGHMDTVGVAGTTEPWTPRITDGRMVGRGAYDMKCGLAAAMVATARAKQANLRGDLSDCYRRGRWLHVGIDGDRQALQSRCRDRG